MPEPTNHRAEAERFMLSAVDSWANADTGNEDEVRTRIAYAVSEALIGIGHALLALGQRRNITADELRQALPKICTHREQVHGVEKGCAMWANHPGEHRLTVFSPAPHPPLKDHGTDTVYRVTPPNPDDVGTSTWHGNQMHRFHVPPVSPSEG